jgi:hypothetical protein
VFATNCLNSVFARKFPAHKGLHRSYRFHTFYTNSNFSTKSPLKQIFMQLDYFIHKTDDITCKYWGWHRRGSKLKMEIFTRAVLFVKCIVLTVMKQLASGKLRQLKKLKNGKKSIQSGKMGIQTRA